MLSDVTERKRMENELHQSQRMEAVGQLTGGIAHDFNNLLTVILGNAEMLADDLPRGSTLRHMAEMTRAAAEQGAELTGRLLAFARRQTLDPRSTDVARLVHDIDGLLRRILGEHIEIRTERAENLWPAYIDAALLESAVLNLCINARDAMPKGGKLCIELRNAEIDERFADEHAEPGPGQYVMLAVSDDGTGMTPEVLARAFEPFFTTKEVGKGSGLGLSMVFGFVKQSKGAVRIYSELGEGTTVKLYLPRAIRRPGPVEASPQPAAPHGGNERILLVEDDAMVREHLRSALLALGYRVVAVENGPEAVARLRSHDGFDLLLTDVVMPGGMSGREVADAARELRPQLAVLFTSGYAESAIVHHGRLEPGVHLIAKPFHRAELARKVREALAGAES